MVADLLTRTQAFADAHSLPVVAGSDSHHYLQLGSVHNNLTPFPTGSLPSIPDLKAAIRERRFSLNIRDGLFGKVGAARQAKSAMKAALLECEIDGGD